MPKKWSVNWVTYGRANQNLGYPYMKIKSLPTLALLACCALFSNAFAATPMPLYYTLYGLNNDATELDQLANNYHVTSINAGMLLIKKGQTCSYENLTDGVNNPIDSHFVTNKHVSDFVTNDGGHVELVFGGNPGNSAADPLIVCNQAQLTQLITEILSKTVDPITHKQLVSGIDFDIENNIHADAGEAPGDTPEFWSKITATLKAIKAQQSLTTMISIPEYSSYWAAGFDAPESGMKAFFKSAGNTIDKVNIMMNGVPISSYQSYMQQTLQHAAIPSSIKFAITSIYDSQSPDEYVGLNDQLKKTAANYDGATVWGAVSAQTGALTPQAVTIYQTLNGITPPAPTPTKGGLTIIYKGTQWAQLSCWTNPSSQSYTIAAGQSAVIQNSAPQGSITSVGCSMKEGQPVITYAHDTWTVSAPSGVTANCSANTCTLSD